MTAPQGPPVTSIGDRVFGSVRGVVRRIFIENFPYKLLSVLIAVGLWALVRDETVTDTVELPLSVVSSPDLVVVNEPPKMLVVDVSGPRATVEKHKQADHEAVSLLLPDAEAGSFELSIPPAQIELEGVQVTGVTPRRVEVFLERKAARDIRVQPRLLGRAAEGYTVGRASVEPEFVRIVGAASMVRALEVVYTEPISIGGQSRSFAHAYAINLPGDGQVWMNEPGPVRVTVTIVPSGPSPDMSPTFAP